MDILTYAPFILFFAAELVLLLGLYYFVLRHWIADHLEDRFREDEGSWLIDILSPAIENICDRIITTAPDAVLKVLKHEMLSNQGTLTRVSKADGNNEQEVGLEMAEMALQGLGIKKPGVIMTLRMGQQLLNLYNNNKGQGTQGSTLPIGDELI